jgi:sugar lactone lactonase YvrE/enterochelin esterase-like enzyme
MRRVLLLLAVAGAVSAQTPDREALVKRIQAGLTGAFPPVEAKPNPAIPHGEFIQGQISNSAIYPGTENSFQVYVPAQYDPSHSACLLVKLDGLGAFEGTVLDSLIASKEVPVIIGVGITPGTIWKDPAGTPQRAAYRFNRSYEFDSMNGRFPDFVLNEILPAVQKLITKDGRPVKISPNGNDHAATGGSTGGIGSFSLAWNRPDQFTRVYSIIGTFVSMRGGNEYPVLVRKTDPKPIRIFLEDGATDSWNPIFGSWFDANLNMESALTFAGYDVAHAWGDHGHNGRAGQTVFPDVMRWLWAGYPAPVQLGISKNSTLEEISIPGQGWNKFENASGTALASNAKGEIFVGDGNTILRIGADGKPVRFHSGKTPVAAQAFGPDGTLYAAVPAEKKVIAIDAQVRARTIAEGIAARGIVVKPDGAIYITEPGQHGDMPSRVWRIDGSKKTRVDEGPLSASGVAFAPDGSLFYVAEKTTKWIYTYVVRPDGSLTDKQPYFWLHMTDVPNDSGAEDLALDIHGNLYVATRMGIQVCDQNGRVRAILPLPTPSGPVLSLAFGGEHFDTLYATDGMQLFARKLKVPGYPQFSKPVKVTSHGAG